MLKTNKTNVTMTDAQAKLYAKVFEVLSGFSSNKISLVHEGNAIKLYSLSIFNRKTRPMLLLTATVGADEFTVELFRGKNAGVLQRYKLRPNQIDRVIGEYLTTVYKDADAIINPKQPCLPDGPL